jgi:DNA topoisomerase VI subunit B
MRRLPESPSARTGIGGGALFRKPAMNAAPVTARARSEPRLVRETFSSSRLLEFCSQRELIAQTGHLVEDWPLVVIKELTDNAIDGVEEAGVAPQLAVTISRETGEIVVEDNGPGIPTETVDNVLDYTARASSREAYVSPTRGAQGNALKTLVAMPFVLDGNAGETVIEAKGIAHRIRFTVDPIRQEPRISCDRASSSVKNGTRVTVAWPAKACRLLDDDEGRFLPFCWDYAALNPHLALSVKLPDGESINWPEATTPDWEKWRPTDQIPAHWYSAERLQRLIAACINRDQKNGKRVRRLREFVRDFRGLTGSGKLAAVLDELGLSRARLDTFFQDDRVDHNGIARLLAAMQQHSKPVKPERLGLIGREHFGRIFAVDGADPDQVKYSRELGHDGDLPFLVEAAFARIKDLSSTPLV